MLSLLIFVLFTSQGPGKMDLSKAVSLYGQGSFIQVASVLAPLCPDQVDCGEARLWLGRSYFKMHRWDDAIRELKTTVHLSPSNSHYHLWLGRAYGEKAAHVSIFAALGPAGKVVGEFETAQKLAPSDLEIHFDLLQFYLAAPGIIGGGRDKAEAQAKAIAQINKRAGQTAQARLHEHDKKWAEALQELTQSTKDFPNDPEAHGELADFLFKRKDYQGAEAAAAKALALRSWHPMAQFIQAACQVQQRTNLETAEASLLRLTEGPLQEQDPNFEHVYYWLGVARLAQDKVTAAREAFLAALRYDPDHKDAQTALSKLKSD